jgi:hypothetical protein
VEDDDDGKSKESAIDVEKLDRFSKIQEDECKSYEGIGITT